MLLWVLPRLDPVHLGYPVPQGYQVDWVDYYSSHMHQPLNLLLHCCPVIHLCRLNQHHLRLHLHLALHSNLKNQQVRNCYRYDHYHQYPHHHHSHHYLLLG